MGFHYYTRRIVADASKEQFLGGGKFSGTEIENNAPGGRDPYTRFRAAMPKKKVHLPTLGSKYGRVGCTSSSLRSQGITTIQLSKLLRAAAGISMGQLKIVRFCRQRCRNGKGAAEAIQFDDIVFTCR